MYFRVYHCKKMKSASVGRKALELLDNGIITAYIKTLNEEIKFARSDRKGTCRLEGRYQMSRTLKDYLKKLQYLQDKFPEEVNSILQKGANHFVNGAITLTDKEKLVDTGSYRRKWGANHSNNSIVCFNSSDYASHLEWGHKTRNGGRVKGYFVGTKAVKNTREYILNAFKVRFKHLYKKQ